MKRIALIFILSVTHIGSVFSAADTMYFGVKAGLMMPDIPEMSNATNIGFVIGSKLKNEISVEGEMTITALDGDVSIFGVSGDWDVMTIAGYGVYRSEKSGGVYFKGKAGLLYEDVNIQMTGLPVSSSGTDTGLSLGFGAGFDIGNGQTLEVEYTIIESDVSFLSVGVNF
ncbi:MAG: porin family protein [Gammaproteobacteria bacterium]|nr:porin family protein [Gammaproteobacteria bacterium]